MKMWMKRCIRKKRNAKAMAERMLLEKQERELLAREEAERQRLRSALIMLSTHARTHTHSHTLSLSHTHVFGMHQRERARQRDCVRVCVDSVCERERV